MAWFLNINKSFLNIYKSFFNINKSFFNINKWAFINIKKWFSNINKLFLNINKWAPSFVSWGSLYMWNNEYPLHSFCPLWLSIRSCCSINGVHDDRVARLPLTQMEDNLLVATGSRDKHAIPFYLYPWDEMLKLPSIVWNES